MTTHAPNLLIIGAARSGTTALARFLSEHPEAFVSTPKETHLLAFANGTTTFSGPGDDEMMNRKIVREPDRWLRLFEGGADRKVRCDGSVSSLYYPDAAVANIERYCAPDCRMIVVLRNPIERSHSAYLYLRQRGHEPFTTFEEGLAAEAERIAAGWHHMWWYQQGSRYSSYLAPFIAAFGRERVQVIFHDELNDSPDSTLAAVWSFAGISPHHVDTDVEVNRGGEPRSAAFQQLIRTLRSNETIRRAVNRTTSRALRDRISSKNLVRSAADPATVRQLHRSFADEITALETLLKRPVPASWKAPR